MVECAEGMAPIPIQFAQALGKKARESSPSPFVADGHLCACEASEPRIRKQVEEEFADQLSNAPFWRRFVLRRKIEREITRRIETVAPREALY
jgi:hypothetical protein